MISLVVVGRSLLKGVGPVGLGLDVRGLHDLKLFLPKIRSGRRLFPVKSIESGRSWFPVESVKSGISGFKTRIAAAAAVVSAAAPIIGSENYLNLFIL